MLNTAVQNGSTLNALADCLNAAVYLRVMPPLITPVTHQLGHLGHLQAVMTLSGSLTSSIRPRTSVSRISFFAPSATASLLAAVSALIL